MPRPKSCSRKAGQPLLGFFLCTLVRKLGESALAITLERGYLHKTKSAAASAIGAKMKPNFMPRLPYPAYQELLAGIRRIVGQELTSIMYGRENDTAKLSNISAGVED